MKIATGTLVALLALAGCSSTAEPATAPQAPVQTQAPIPPPVPEPVTPEAVPLTAADFDLEIKTLSKQCFGSAGCNVTVRVEIATDLDLIEGRSGEITVQVTGDESGPVIETFDFDGTTYTPPEIALSTLRSDTQIQAEITDVSER